MDGSFVVGWTTLTTNTVTSLSSSSSSLRTFSSKPPSLDRRFGTITATTTTSSSSIPIPTVSSSTMVDLYGPNNNGDDDDKEKERGGGDNGVNMVDCNTMIDLGMHLVTSSNVVLPLQPTTAGTATTTTTAVTIRSSLVSEQCFNFCHPEIGTILSGPDNKQRQQQQQQSRHIRTNQDDNNMIGNSGSDNDVLSLSSSSFFLYSDDKNNRRILRDAFGRFDHVAASKGMATTTTTSTATSTKTTTTTNVTDLIDLAVVCDSIIFSSTMGDDNEGMCGGSKPCGQGNESNVRTTTTTTTEKLLSVLVEGVRQQQHYQHQQEEKRRDDEQQCHDDDNHDNDNNSNADTYGGNSIGYCNCGADVMTTVTTLLALNGLEATIRRLSDMIPVDDDTGNIKLMGPNNDSNGSDVPFGSLSRGSGRNGSPLLKDMIANLNRASQSTLSDNRMAGTESAEATTTTITTAPAAVVVPVHLVRVCQLLLLPSDNGLNFRNLVWHGFIPFVPRPWFALVVVLTRELDTLLVTSSNTIKNNIDSHNIDRILSPRLGDDDDELFDLRRYPEYRNILSKEQVVADPTSEEEERSKYPVGDYANPPIDTQCGVMYDRITHWIESSTSSPGHVALWKLAQEWIYRSAPFVSPLTKQKQETTSRRTNGDRPSTICAILTVVLEHALRMEWCRANDRPNDRIARPGAFYVTLDGHGQRHVHDLILHPYLLDVGTDNSARMGGTGPRRKNRLIMTQMDDSTDQVVEVQQEQQQQPASHMRVASKKSVGTLDGSTWSLLTDLYCSPFGPNVRASIAHGLWDDYLQNEWCDSTDSTTKMNAASRRKLWDMVETILTAMDRVAAKEWSSNTKLNVGHPTKAGGTECLLSQEVISAHHPTDIVRRPVFSYAQETRRLVLHAEEAVMELVNTLQVQSASPLIGYRSLAKQQIPDLLGEEVILSVFEPFGRWTTNSIHPIHDAMANDSTYDVYEEFDVNQQLAPLGATRMLLQEIATATRSLLHSLDDAVTVLETTEGTDSSTVIKRRRKTALRVIRCCEVVSTMYSFALSVARFSIDSIIVRPQSLTLNQPTCPKFGDDVMDVKTIAHAVGRTRMVVSTVDRFVVTNQDRAMKSVVEYTKSKAVQVVHRYLINMSKNQDD